MHASLSGLNIFYFDILYTEIPTLSLSQCLIDQIMNILDQLNDLETALYEKHPLDNLKPFYVMYPKEK